MVDLDEVVPRLVLPVSHHVRGIVYRADGNAEPGGPVVQVVSGLCEGPGVHLVRELHQVMAAIRHVLPLIALAPRRIAHELAEELEVVVVERVEDDVPVAGLQTTHRRRSVGHAGPGRLVVAGGSECGRHQAEEYILDGHVDEHPLAAVLAPSFRAAFVEQRGERERQDEAAVETRRVAAQGDRRAVDVARARRHQVRQTAGVGQCEFAGRRAGARSGKPPGGDRADDQIVRQPGRRFAIQDDCVGRPEQSVQQLPVGFVCRVDDDAALARVAVEKERRIIVACAARLVARWRLDLDHVGAQIGEQLAAVGPGGAVRHLDHAKSGEGPVRHRSLYASRAPRSQLCSSPSPK